MNRPRIIKKAPNKIIITKENTLPATIDEAIELNKPRMEQVLVSAEDAIDTLMAADLNQYELLVTVAEVQNGIYREFLRQYGKWGSQYHSLPAWEMITAEEYGEWVKEMNNVVYSRNPTRADYDAVMTEGIEMIACAVQCLHELRRRRDGLAGGEYTVQNTPKE